MDLRSVMDMRLTHRADQQSARCDDQRQGDDEGLCFRETSSDAAQSEAAEEQRWTRGQSKHSHAGATVKRVSQQGGLRQGRVKEAAGQKRRGNSECYWLRQRRFGQAQDRGRNFAGTVKSQRRLKAAMPNQRRNDSSEFDDGVSQHHRSEHDAEVRRQRLQPGTQYQCRSETSDDSKQRVSGHPRDVIGDELAALRKQGPCSWRRNASARCQRPAHRRAMKGAHEAESRHC